MFNLSRIFSGSKLGEGQTVSVPVGDLPRNPASHMSREEADRINARVQTAVDAVWLKHFGYPYFRDKTFG